MNKKALIITLSSVALLGAGIGLFVYFKNKKDAESSDGQLTDQQIKDLIKAATQQGGAVGDADNTEYSAKDKMVGDVVLKVGSKGRRVAMLQALLNHYKGGKLKIDGVFGNDTRLELLKNKYFSCAVPTMCEVGMDDFLALLKRTESDKTFSQKYSPNKNNDMKAVYDKYSS